MRILRRTSEWTYIFTIVMVLSLLAATKLSAQATDGNLVGTIVDQAGGAAPDTTVEVTNVETNVKTSTLTGSDGGYRVNNILAGTYDIKISRTGFSSINLHGISVVLNQTVTQNATLRVGDVATVVNVTDTAATIDTTTAQISTTYTERAAIDVPVASLGLGVLNLSLLNAGVASPGGLGQGEGPSVGGQRPRSNNFMIEGVDNNNRDFTGRIIAIPSEATQEFTVIQNQAAAEFGGGSGGQFNVVLRGGSNKIHGSLHEYFENRNLDALDQASVRQGILTVPRFDSNTMGGSIGGPIIKDKLFYYGLFQYNPTGFAGSVNPAIDAPTAQGYNLISAIPGLSQTNLQVLKKYLPAATIPDPNGATTSVTNPLNGNSVEIPLGVIPIVGPTFTNIYNWLVSVDYNISSKDQLRGRDLNELHSGFDAATLPALPAFYQPRPTKSRLFSLSEFHTFSPTILNEFRFGYSRFNDNVPAGNFSFPGLDAFPNLFFDDLGVQLGPYPTSPQTTALNSYQLVDNLSWTKGRHALKFGWQGRKYISTETLTAQVRGNYDYSSIDGFLNDITPDEIAQRAIGGAPYSGNAIDHSLFVQDEFRLRPNLTISPGLRYDYKGVSAGNQLQALNAISSVPGLISFQAPVATKNNWAPRFGIAYSPGHSGTTTIRAGFGISYDKSFDNLDQQTRPAQFTTLVDQTGQDNSNFLANGGIRQQTGYRVFPNAAAARAATSGYQPIQYILPYAEAWNIGVTHVFHNDYTLEVRYLGTKGVHLPTQSQINIQSKVTPSNNIPTFLTAPSASTLASLNTTLGSFSSISKFLPQYAPYFPNAILSFPFRGNSLYNGLAVELTRRFSRGMLFKTAYTWSHAMDDSTADLNNTALSPRRAQDSQNMSAEWGNSFLDRRHRFTQTMVYDTPWFKNNPNWFLKNLAGNFVLSGTYTYESPQYATVQSGVDSNLNGDSASDRAIVNVNGVTGTGSGVTGYGPSGSPVSSSTTCSVAGASYKGNNCIVAYVANNSTAQYIVAGQGALANSARQTLPTRPINNFDLQVKKVFSFQESKRFEVGVQMFNALNHPQYTPGFQNTVQQLSSLQRDNLVPGNVLFNRPDTQYSSNPRYIQLTARFQF